MPKEASRIFLISLCSLALSLFTSAVLIFIFQFIPVSETAKADFFPDWIQLVRPEREAFFYRFWILSAICFQILIFWMTRQKPDAPSEVERPLKEHAGFRVLDILIPLFIAVIVFVPNREGVIAQIFTQDAFHHFDTFVASPAWAATKGNILNVDTYTQYGFGMPVLVSTLSAALGGVTYENILLSLVGLAIVYLWSVYIFLRKWFRNVVIAALGTVLVLKFQMFSNSAADPIIWRYPSTTVVRYLFDTLFFIFILLHRRHQQRRYLFVTGALCGVAVVYLTDSGVYLTAAYYAYVLLTFLSDREKKALWIDLVCLALPVVSAAVYLFAVVGPGIFQPAFWNNFSDFIRLTNAGWGAMPVTTFLEQKRYLNVFMGFIMCIVYVFTVLSVTGLLYRRIIHREHVLAVVVAVYGLGTFHYFIARSAPDNIPVVSIPFIFLICYWLYFTALHFRERIKSVHLAVLLLMAFAGLLTTRAFLQYPNIFNLSGKTFVQERANMKDQFYSPKDIELIKALTRPDEKVCLFSTLETAVLMAANRRPQFYYFPIMFPRSFKMRDFGGTALFTHERFDKTIDDFESQKPRYVFIEKKFLGGLPSLYYIRYEVLRELLAYLDTHYRIVAGGEYLVALKRID